MLRNMTVAELETCLTWARDEGWNPGVEDAPAFFAADPDGFFVAEVNGEMAACISVVNQCETQSFLGLYICRPEWRGRGIGYALWQHALKHAGSRTVGLDGVPDQQDNYRRSDFEGSGQTVRFQGALGQGTQGTRRAAPDDMAQLLTLDTRAAGYARTAYASAWFESTDTRETRVIDREGRIEGFATFRQCHDGIKIGALQANTETDARLLLQSVPVRFDSTPCFVDTATGSALAHVLERSGFAPVFSTARMYRGTAPNAKAPLYFAPTTLELG
ncbi:GNAT family N-acetyltransferase [Epibacterium ulvae]|nr:GNAT family N-acetyltransferase [Epibacterium ulvae]